MPNIPYMFSPFKNIEAFIGAILGFSIILLFTQHSGLGISRDSIAYVSGADSFIAGKGFIEYDNVPLTLFPLGYPIILGIIKFITHTTILSFGVYLNAFLFATVIFLLGCIIKQQVYPNIVLLITLIAVLVFATPLHEAYYMLWSESLFMFLELLFIIALQQYSIEQKKRWLYLAIILAAYAAITRFAGITFIATLGLFLLIDNVKNTSLINRWIRAILFTFLAVIPLALNLIRNYTSTLEPAGNRQKGIYTLLDNLGFSGKVFCEWIYSSTANISTTIAIGTAILLLFISYSIYITTKIIRHSKPINYYEIATIFGTVYYTFILSIATLSRFETINNRLLSPLYIPLLLLLIHIGERLINSELFSSLRKAKSIAIIIMFILLLSKAVFASVDFYKDSAEGGIGGYTEDSWSQSETIKYVIDNIKQYTDSIPVFSNSAHALYLYSGKHFALIPEKTHEQKIENLFKLNQFYVIWFNEEGNSDILPVDAIGKNVELKIVNEFNDGIIYLAKSKE